MWGTSLSSHPHSSPPARCGGHWGILRPNQRRFFQRGPLLQGLLPKWHAMEGGPCFQGSEWEAFKIDTLFDGEEQLLHSELLPAVRACLATMRKKLLSMILSFQSWPRSHHHKWRWKYRLISKSRDLSFTSGLSSPQQSDTATTSLQTPHRSNLSISC